MNKLSILNIFSTICGKFNSNELIMDVKLSQAIYLMLFGNINLNDIQIVRTSSTLTQVHVHESYPLRYIHTYEIKCNNVVIDTYDVNDNLLFSCGLVIHRVLNNHIKKEL